MKSILKLIIPPLFLTLWSRIFNSQRYGWHGDYKTWQEASRISTGYDSKIILDRVCNALLKVKKKEAVFERDSVLFDKIQYSWQLLTGLMYAAVKNNGELSVLDFGGSLGSSYYQNKKFLDGLKSVKWSIIEQENFVRCGKMNFANDVLNFYYTVDDCLQEQMPNVLILSSVLQYIEKPYELLGRLLKYKFDLIVIDRTPFSQNGQDVITLQTVPPEIYQASYPCWLFDEDDFIKQFSTYKLIESFDALDGATEKYYFKGFIFEK